MVDMENGQHEAIEQQVPVVQTAQSTSGLAVAGLVLGILAILGAFVPLLNIGAIPFAVIGLALAVAGYLGIQKGKHTGRGIAIAGMVLGCVSLVVIIGMYGCAGIVASSASSSSAPAGSLATPSASSSSVAGASSSAAASSSKSRTTVGPVSFILPNGWISQKGDGEEMYYYPSATDHTSVIYVTKETVEMTQEQFYGEFKEALMSSFENAFEGFELLESQDLSISGYAANRIKAHGTMQGEDMSYQFCCIYVPNDVYSFVSGSKNGKRDAEIAACFDTLKVHGAAASSSSQSSGANNTSSAQSVNNDEAVSADLKETLDSYEAFMDDYIAFMQKYQETDDITSLMTDYLQFMEDYAGFMDKINSLDTKNMSAADYAYYIEVTSRVSKKLLDAAL